jgi:methylated-DNA-[protein]-cysteine S-methyltransferase
MNAIRETLPTPFGALTVVAAGDTVLGSCFGDPSWLAGRLDGVAVDDGRISPSISAAVAAYLAGEVGSLDAVAVRQPGGPFRQAAWRAMRAIPPGQTWSYARLAAVAGRPAAVRAAGSACARNLVAPFVPCHRVVRSDGSLGGYAYGLDVKRALLAHESGLRWQGVEFELLPPQTGRVG